MHLLGISSASWTENHESRTVFIKGFITDKAIEFLGLLFVDLTFIIKVKNCVSYHLLVLINPV